MYYKLKDNIELLKIHLKGPLYINSFFLILNSITSSGIGFIFWMVAAKFYSTEYMGVSTALISSLNLILMISVLGFDQSIIRFFPNRDKSKLFSTTILITFISGTSFSLLYVMNINFLAPDLYMIKDNFLIFYIFLIANIVTFLSSSVFLALRKAKYLFIQNLITGSRLFLILPFIVFGALGIFISFGVSFILSLIFSIIILFKFGIRPKKIDKEFLKDSFHFSSGNYIFSLLSAIPSQILSIIILNILGAQETAYYYISLTLASILFIIPSSFSTSLFVEGSHGKPLRKNILKSVLFIFSILIPAVIIFYFIGEFILGLINPTYVNALNIFRLMILSSFFMVFYNLFISIKKVQKDMKTLIFIGTMNTIFLIGLSYILMLKFGLVGIGYAWLINYGLISLIIIVIIIKKIILKEE